MADKTYSRDEVNQAVNAGIDLITGDREIYLSGRDHDLLNLAVNAALSLLDNPDWTLDDVIRHNYESEDPEDGPATVRSWLEA